VAGTPAIGRFGLLVVVVVVAVVVGVAVISAGLDLITMLVGVVVIEAGAAKIRRRFGDHVARIVDECSDADKMPKPPWRERKEAHIAHMATASKGALVVIAADKLHNVTCMIDDYLTDGDELWERFDAPCKPGDIFWYYDEMHAALERRLGKIRLVNRVGEGITRLKNRGKTQKVASPS